MERWYMLNTLPLLRPHAGGRRREFRLGKGDVLGFLGPNGAGKTTTMQLITGNLAPSAGRLEVHGIDLLDEPKRAKREIGYLPEQPPVYRELTVEEYLRYCARLNRIARATSARPSAPPWIAAA